MTTFIAPVRDFCFVLDALTATSNHTSSELSSAVLAEAGRFASAVLAPLNVVGDTQGCRLLDDGAVATPPGWRDAYRQFCEGGWNGVSAPESFGGQGMPQTLGTAVAEITCAANPAFSLCPMLARGAIRALYDAGSEALKSRYLQPMVEGRWASAMDLTEPQAGSDLALVRTRAEPAADGTYRLFGQKIFITYGEHDLSENIVHLVLARLPDAPAGTKGISLFLVPKFLLRADGSIGERNAGMRCIAIEHKLGMHGSPTCAMAYEGAIGYLIGAPNRGLEQMFVMMNEERLGTGAQAIAIGERAYQQALAYAQERKQGRDPLTGEAPVPIIRHADVARMLLAMKSRVEASRALALYTAGLIDTGERDTWVDFLTPIVKGWSTEMGIEVASLGVQIHGGAGFIEETGAAQHLRDVRITAIYEGTTGIQGQDLVMRKLLRDGGETGMAIIQAASATATSLLRSERADLRAIGERLSAAVAAWQQTSSWILERGAAQVLSSCVPYLFLSGVACGGWMLGQCALAAARELEANPGDRFLQEKIVTARFFADHVLVQASAHAQTVCAGDAVVREWQALSNL